ncbi:MAG: hypothetical protein AB8B52_08075 [Winogradskyella sp.]|uniref:hypothetical protein n=1 Tax=Winogradskyella sp. TaxID=1883156 RepID=UPI00385DD704
MRNIIALLHPIEKKETIRLDFQTELLETDIYEKLKLPEYGIYQFIENDFLYNMEQSELDAERIKYYELKREKKTWFGLSKKTVTDLLIQPKNKFYYPYQYGHYFYLYTKHKVNPAEFQEWINIMFPNKFTDFDDTLFMGTNENFEFLNKDDYFLITHHDYQRDFGISANEIITNELLKILRKEEVQKEFRNKRK